MTAAPSSSSTRRAVLTIGDAATWAAASGLTGVAMRNAALYFPRIRQADPLRGGSIDDLRRRAARSPA